MIRWCWLSLVLLFAGCGCDEETPPETDPPPAGHAAGEEAARPGDERSIAGGLSWSAPAPLRARAPSSQMRAAEYTVGGSEDAVLTVYFFGPGQGGSIEENVDRWVGQLAQPDGRNPREAAEIERRDASGIEITRIELEGTYSGGMGPMAGGPPREGYKLLGAIAVGPQAPVFFKLVGPAQDVDRAEAAFDRLLASIERFR